jgi:hypothetical protein
MAAAEGPAAQLDLLRDGFQAAGKTLSEMPFFQQKMLASELGLELGVLQQVIDGNMDSQQALAKENPLEELAKKANSALDRLNDTIQSMSAGLGTLIDMFTFAIDNIKLIGGAVLFASAAFKMYALEQAAATTAQSLNIVVTEQGTLAVTKQNGQILTNNTLTAANSGAQTQNAAAKTANAGATVGLAGAETTAAAATNGLSFSMKGLAASINMVFLGLGAAVGAFMIFDAIGAKLADTLGPGITAFIALAAAIGLAYTAFTLGVGTAGILAGAAALAAGVVSFKAAIGGYEGGGEGPTIPGLATGGMIVGSGMAMVGEEGPELVSLPKGAQVVNNQSTTNLMKTMEETKVSNTTNTTANDGAMLQALLRIEKALNMQPAGTAGSSAQPINVSVQLDKKKVGEATVDYINKRYDVFTSN